MLYLLLFATFSASASDIVPTAMPSLTEWARSEWKQYNGILYLRVPIAGGRWCFSRSTAGIAAKSSEWEYVAPQVFVTIPASIEQIQVCTDTLPSWKVAPNLVSTDTPPTRPLKDINYTNTGYRIPVGASCEDMKIKTVSTTTEYHWATNSAGNRGLVICSR